MASMDASLPDSTLRPMTGRKPFPAPGGSRSRLAAMILLAISFAASAAGCRLTPLTDRDWAPELSRMAAADFDGEQVRVHNVRNSNYRTDTDFDLSTGRSGSYDPARSSDSASDYISRCRWPTCRESRTLSSVSASMAKTSWRSRSKCDGSAARSSTRCTTFSMKTRSSISPETSAI